MCSSCIYANIFGIHIPACILKFITFSPAAHRHTHPHVWSRRLVPNWLRWISHFGVAPLSNPSPISLHFHYVRLEQKLNIFSNGLHICISQELNLVLHIWDALNKITDHCLQLVLVVATVSHHLIRKKSENYETTVLPAACCLPAYLKGAEGFRARQFLSDLPLLIAQTQIQSTNRSWLGGVCSCDCYCYR